MIVLPILPEATQWERNYAQPEQCWEGHQTARTQTAGGETAGPQAGTLDQTGNGAMGQGHPQGGTIADLQREELFLLEEAVRFPRGVAPGHPGHRQGGEDSIWHP